MSKSKVDQIIDLAEKSVLTIRDIVGMLNERDQYKAGLQQQPYNGRAVTQLGLVAESRARQLSDDIARIYTLLAEINDGDE